MSRIESPNRAGYMRAPPRSIRGSILLPPSMCASSASPARPFKIDGRRCRSAAGHDDFGLGCLSRRIEPYN
ncbi:hypothetical protein FKP32DRAFT_1126018 [Trametes sanguinea]|nr:hypothetical protein FKP32DRAFT_1126018 [Trametes sanguinea]